MRVLSLVVMLGLVVSLVGCSYSIEGGENIEVTEEDGVVIITGTGSGSLALDDLTDVNLALLAEGDYLVYDNTSSRWVNRGGMSGTGQVSSGTPLVSVSVNCQVSP